MPSTRIATGSWARGQEAQLLEAVQAAMSSVLNLPDWDQNIVIDCYDSTQRLVPAGRSTRFTRVEIMLFAGRSLDTKRNLYKAIATNLEAVGVPLQEVTIVLIEVAPENWGIRGGLPASEVELGFKIDV